MTWLFRFSFIACVLLMSFGACTGESDVGNPCKFTLEESSRNLKELKEKARIAEPSFACAYSYCIANYYNPEKEGFGYCTKRCESVSDCPTGFTCEVFLQAKDLPDDYKASFTELSGQQVCIKTPPKPTTEQ